MNTAVNSKRVFYVAPHRPQGYAEILGKRDDVRLDMLEQKTPDDAALEILGAAHAYQIGSARDELVRHYQVGAELLGRAPNLLIASTNGAGYDTVDVRMCTERGVLVVNQSGGNAEAVAEHVIGMMLCLVKRVGETDRALRAGAISNRADYIGREAYGRTLGIVGLGNVGRRIAELAGGLFKMQVLAYDPYLSADVVRARGAAKVELDDLMRRSDFVSINCPLTPETRNLIGEKEYALMQPTAYFITSARGSIHDEAALERVLRDKKIAGAGLDVWEKEPPPAQHPLMKYDNVMVTPHMAGVTRESRARMGQIAAEQILDALDGKPVPRIVNPQVWPVYAKRFEKTFGFKPAAPPDEPNWHEFEK
jgi:D-3-phosphoglycerate dehydrogenase / 2-oxoglutarate reductase